MPFRIRTETLYNHDVAVYCVDIDSTRLYRSYFQSVLSSEEKDRSARFRFDKDRNRYVVQHTILRILLSSHLGCNPEDIKFRRDRYGKPSLKNPRISGLFFNSSSSGNIVSIAIANHCELGIDIEKVQPIHEMKEIVANHFTNNEKLQLNSCPYNHLMAVFYKIWTRKEAVLKALGVGLLVPLSEIDVCTEGELILESGSRVVIVPDKQRINVFDLESPNGYSLALATMEKTSNVIIQHLPLNVQIM